jgi:hypothetical protein
MTFWKQNKTSLQIPLQLKPNWMPSLTWLKCIRASSTVVASCCFSIVLATFLFLNHSILWKLGEF